MIKQLLRKTWDWFNITTVKQSDLPQLTDFFHDLEMKYKNLNISWWSLFIEKRLFYLRYHSGWYGRSTEHILKFIEAQYLFKSRFKNNHIISRTIRDVEKLAAIKAKHGSKTSILFIIFLFIVIAFILPFKLHALSTYPIISVIAAGLLILVLPLFGYTLLIDKEVWNSLICAIEKYNQDSSSKENYLTAESTSSAIHLQPINEVKEWHNDLQKTQNTGNYKDFTEYENNNNLTSSPLEYYKKLRLNTMYFLGMLKKQGIINVDSGHNTELKKFIIDNCLSKGYKDKSVISYLSIKKIDPPKNNKRLEILNSLKSPIPESEQPIPTEIIEEAKEFSKFMLDSLARAVKISFNKYLTKKHGSHFPAKLFEIFFITQVLGDPELKTNNNNSGKSLSASELRSYYNKIDLVNITTIAKDIENTLENYFNSP